MATFDLIAGLSLEVDRYELTPLAAELSPGFTRHCTLVRLSGRGLSGIGEDVVYEQAEQAAFQQGGAVHDLTGNWTLASFCDRVAALDLFAQPPEYEASRHYRLWAFHSAALDLALRQAGIPLHRALRREPSPMRYVASTRLGEPPSLDPVTKRLELDPTLRFKLDATSSWGAELLDALVATGSVDSIDFKGLYGGRVVDQPADPALYRRVADAFPDAWLEDPDLSLPDAAAALAGEHARITWDVPIHSVDDIEALPFKPRMVNLKPSRIGSLPRLMETYDYCELQGIGAYGGGQTELGVGRGQAQYLASLFHPDAPNDLAPSAYNLADPPAGLPSSPLRADLSSPGFRWPGD
jgi:hypothetical protein